MYIYIYIYILLCSTPKNNPAFYINYISIKIFKLKKNEIQRHILTEWNKDK